MLLRYRMHQLVYGCVLALILLGLAFSTGLEWQECLRLVFIQGGLGLLYRRYRDRLGAGIGISQQQGKSYPGAILAALSVVFALSQFGPAPHDQSAFAHFYRGTVLLLIYVPFALFLASGYGPRLRPLRRADWLVAAVVGGAVGALFTTSQSDLSVLTGENILASARYLGYLLVWFLVTRLYADPGWAVEQRSGLAGLAGNRWRGTLAGIMLLFTVAVISGSYRAGGVLYAYQQGRDLLQRENWPAALEHYEEVRRMNQRVGLESVQEATLLDLAFLYLQGDREQAAQAIFANLRRMDRRAAMQLRIAAVYQRAGRWRRAAYLYQNYLQVAGVDTVVLQRLGEVYVYAEDKAGLQQLVDKYRRAPQLEEASARQHILLGDAHFYLRDFAAAVRSYSSAVEQEIGSPYFNYKLGWALLEARRFEAAAVALKRAVHLRPDFAEAYFRLGQSRQAQNNQELAWEAYSRVVELQPQHLEGRLALRRLQLTR